MIFSLCTLYDDCFDGANRQVVEHLTKSDCFDLALIAMIGYVYAVNPTHTTLGLVYIYAPT